MIFNAIEAGAIKEEETVLVNSTSKDFPEGYEGKRDKDKERYPGGGRHLIFCGSPLP